MSEEGRGGETMGMFPKEERGGQRAGMARKGGEARIQHSFGDADPSSSILVAVMLHGVMVMILLAPD